MYYISKTDMQPPGCVRLLPLVENTDGCVVGDDIRRQVLRLHSWQQPHGCVWLLPLFASTDGCAIGDDNWKTIARHTV